MLVEEFLRWVSVERVSEAKAVIFSDLSYFLSNDWLDCLTGKHALGTVAQGPSFIAYFRCGRSIH